MSKLERKKKKFNIGIMKKNVFILIFMCSCAQLFSQYTLIPDVEFESRLIEQGIDTEGNHGTVKYWTDDIDHILNLYIVTEFPDTETSNPRFNRD